MKTYIFDLDGTLVDSMSIAWKQVLLKFLEDRGIVYPKDLIKKVIALGFLGIAKYYKENFNVEENVEDIMTYFSTKMQVLYDNVILAKPHVEETLKALKERGDSLNVLTASPHCFLDPCLKRLGLTQYFDNLWSGEDFPTTKADPLIYKLVAERLGVAPTDCIMVDDSLAPLIPAKKVGFKTVGVYDEISKEYEAEMREVSDLYVYTFKELL